MKPYIRVNAVICPTCKQTIYSRCRHDFRSCSCGETSIDGGFDYIRINYKNSAPQIVNKTVFATKTELYEDWNYRKNKYGVII